jgi:phage recombination protein Bet
MSNGNLALVNNGAMQLDEAKVDLISRTIANGAPPLEFEMFIAMCNRTGLDPIAKQVYFIKRGDKWSAQTSIDGYRLIAERTGQYAGSDEPVYDDESGDHPGKASVTVWKLVGGQRVPFSASARWSEYKQDTSPMWKKMPYLMLGKCAESLALRKAFPQELSGIYTKEEMDQAGPYVEAAGVVVDKATGEIVNDAQREMWETVIETAETTTDLKHIAADMKDDGITEDTSPGLIKLYKQTYNRLRIAEAKQTSAA